MLCRPRGPLEATRQEVGVRRVAEGAAELAAEVSLGETRGPSEVLDVERLGIAGVGEVLGAQQVAGGRYERHRRSLGSRP